MVLVSKATRRKAVSLAAAAHIAIVTAEVQVRAVGTTDLRTAPVAAEGPPVMEKTIAVLQVPGCMHF